MSTADDLTADQLQVHVEDLDGTCVIRLRGELDFACTDRVREALRRAEEGDSAAILIDLENLRFIDSAGLALLLEVSRRSNGSQRIWMTRGNGHVARMLRLTGLDQTLPFAYDARA